MKRRDEVLAYLDKHLSNQGNLKSLLIDSILDIEGECTVEDSECIVRFYNLDLLKIRPALVYNIIEKGTLDLIQVLTVEVDFNDFSDMIVDLQIINSRLKN